MDGPGAIAGSPPTIIRIATAIIDDGARSILLVRKVGTIAFMQPGGKIEAGETAVSALSRELREEIGLDLAGHRVAHVGRHCAPAANEPGHIVDAELFYICCPGPFTCNGEIAELTWLDATKQSTHVLAPLTRDHALPFVRRRLHDAAIVLKY